MHTVFTVTASPFSQLQVHFHRFLFMFLISVGNLVYQRIKVFNASVIFNLNFKMQSNCHCYYE